MTTPSSTGSSADPSVATASDISRWGYNPDQIEELDDWASEWANVRKEGGIWGGRKRGGRGIRITTGMIPDIVVQDVTMQFCGKTLLSYATLSFLRGHRYVLVGPNGSGKSTLLRRMAKGLVPGFPLHLKVVYLQQEIPSIADESIRAIDFLMASIDVEGESSIDNRIDALKTQEAKLENMLDNADESTSVDPEEVANELAEITEKIEMLELKKNKLSSGSKASYDDDSTEYEGFVKDNTNKTIIALELSNFELEQLDILQGLGLITKTKVVERVAETASKGKTVEKQVIFNQFSCSKELLSSMKHLSGGWRMRVSLAIALIDSLSSQVIK